MTGYYAYIPRDDGSEPLGTDGKTIRHDLKTDAGAIRAARRALGDTVRVFWFWDWYQSEPFRQIH